MNIDCSKFFPLFTYLIIWITSYVLILAILTFTKFKLEKWVILYTGIFLILLIGSSHLCNLNSIFTFNYKFLVYSCLVPSILPLILNYLSIWYNYYVWRRYFNKLVIFYKPTPPPKLPLLDSLSDYLGK